MRYVNSRELSTIPTSVKVESVDIIDGKVRINGIGDQGKFYKRVALDPTSQIVQVPAIDDIVTVDESGGVRLVSGKIGTIQELSDLDIEPGDSVILAKNRVILPGGFCD